MTTLAEVFERVMADEAERAAFDVAMQTPDTAVAFLKERGCDTTPEDLRAFIDERRAELSDDELNGVSGGIIGFVSKVASAWKFI